MEKKLFMNKHLLLGFRISFWAGLLYSTIAIMTGVLVPSSVIVTDGFFTLIGVILTFISIYVTRFIQQEDFSNFPFGKETLTPLVVFFQYLIILLVATFNIVSAIRSFFNPVPVSELSHGLYFSIFALLYVSITYYLLLRICKQSGNKPILQVEVEQWKFSILFSLGVTSSFILALCLQRAPFGWVVPYIDPVTTILITLAFVVTAIREIKRSIREILSGAPSGHLHSKLSQIIQAEIAQCEHSDYVLRLGKIGDQIIVEIDIIIKPDSKMDSIRVQDRLREQVYAKICDCYQESLWMNISFIGDSKWAE